MHELLVEASAPVRRDIRATEPEADRIARATERVQEFVIEELWYDSPTDWPPCPRHPVTHPLLVEAREGAATWVCPRDQVTVALVGSL